MVRKTVPQQALEMGGLLLRIFGAASRADEGETEMSPHAVRAAIHLMTRGEATIGSLAEGLGISQGWASRVAEEMERAGHLVRERDPHDRRVVRLRLSASATEAMERGANWRADAVARALRPLSANDRDLVRRFLERAADEMERATAGGGGR
jgi:DNA-binding MarR family transcriptional regulator